MIQVLLVILLSGITVRGQGNGPMLNLNQSIYYYNDCSFNASFFNSNCVFSSCSAFSGKRSPSSTECSTVSPVLNTCLMQNTVCEKPVGHLPICHFQVNLFGISAGTVPNALTGTCVLQQGFIDNLNNATYCVTGSTPYTVKINAPSIYSNGNYGCTFAFFGSTIAAPNFNLKLYLNLSATATIDLSTQPPKISTVIDQSNIALDSFDFNGLPDILQQVLKTSLSIICSTLSESIWQQPTSWLPTLLPVCKLQIKAAIHKLPKKCTMTQNISVLSFD